MARPTGVGFLTLELLKELARLGGARYVGMAHAATRRDTELAAAGIELERQPMPLGVLWQQFALPRRLGRDDLDLLWSPLATLPARLPKPAVVSVHDLTPILFPESHTLKVRLSVLPFFQRTLESARRIAVLSRATADDLAFHFPDCRARIEVVYPGVGPEFHPASADQVAAIRDEVGCAEGYLLYVGTLEPRKNLALLLDAWESLRDDEGRTPPLVLSGGSGWHSRGLMRRIERLRGAGLHYLGRTERKRLIRLFQGATAFVYPSLYEGFGLPLLEAMACGVPTLTSNRSSLGEVVADAGLTVDPTSRDDLAAALRRLLEDATLATELGSRGVERAAEFRWDRAAGQMETLFLESLQ